MNHPYRDQGMCKSSHHFFYESCYIDLSEVQMMVLCDNPERWEVGNWKCHFRNGKQELLGPAIGARLFNALKEFRQ